MAPRATFVAPQLATLVDTVPAGDEWLHEVKYDGYRLVAVVAQGRAQLFTRNGLDWTHRFAALAKGLESIKAETAVFDGEAVVFDDDGRTSFQLLQQSIETSTGALAYVAFDLLHLNGIDTRALPLTDRRELLGALLRKSRSKVPQKPRMSEELVGRADLLLDAACRIGLEGIICKSRSAPYQSGRSRAWLKVKCGHRQELLVLGYTPPKGSRLLIGSLLLGVRDSGAIRYAGRVGSGMPDALLRSLAARLGPLKRSTSPLDPPPAGLPAGIQWVDPTLVVEVSFTEWTAEQRLRHPVLLAVREDKPAREVVRERPIHDTTSRDTMTAVAGVTISNPQRVVFPDPGLTKSEVAAYIAKVAPLMLPHVAGRPLTFFRCPEGMADQCFYQKHWSGKIPATLATVMVEQSDGKKPYVVVNDAAGLVTLVQWGILEIHMWGSRADDVEKPDRITFDLDPGDGVSWDDMRTGALAVQTLLDAVGLDCWLKTSGGKGWHVVVPIARRSSWDEVSDFARPVAERLADEAPSKFVSKSSKALRPGKIFIDWLRNTRGSTSVAPWSMRARAGAGVSVPIPWTRLKTVLSGDHYTIPSIMKAKLPADAWAPMLASRQRLTRSIIKTVQG